MLVLLLLIHCAWSVTISHLLVDDLHNPVGIPVTTKPRFSWTLLDLTTTRRGQSQSAFQILVCSTSQCATGDVWDSGRIPGSKPFLNEYGGPTALKPSTKYFWKVRVWDQTNTATAYSQIANFVTSISDFSGANWITGGYVQNQYRTEFTPFPGAVQSAFIHIVGIGYFDFQVNGQRVNDHMLSPGWTDYVKRSYSVTYDLSEFILPGQKNAIGISLGNSWFSCAGQQPGCVNSPPQLLVSGYISTTQGRVYINTTTSTWKVSPGPIKYNSLYNGETYDARAETPGWTVGGFDDSTWSRPSTATIAPARITPQTFEPIRKLTRFPPATISQPFQGVYVVDFGQNMAGLVSITIRNCIRGQNVTLRHAELLTHPPYGPVDGSIYVGNLRSAKATDVYTCKGSDAGVERYSPRFTQHGFRFVEVRGLSQNLVEDDITADEMHTDAKEIGELNSPISLLNKIQHNTVWGQKK